MFNAWWPNNNVFKCNWLQQKKRKINNISIRLTVFSSSLGKTSSLVWSWSARAFLKLTDQTGSSRATWADRISPSETVKTIGWARTETSSSEIGFWDSGILNSRQFSAEIPSSWDLSNLWSTLVYLGFLTDRTKVLDSRTCKWTVQLMAWNILLLKCFIVFFLVNAASITLNINLLTTILLTF